jgi:hypothetical protein
VVFSFSMAKTLTGEEKDSRRSQGHRIYSFHRYIAPSCHLFVLSFSNLWTRVPSIPSGPFRALLSGLIEETRLGFLIGSDRTKMAPFRSRLT